MDLYNVYKGLSPEAQITGYDRIWQAVYYMVSRISDSANPRRSSVYRLDVIRRSYPLT
jgi:hypothetical protein